MKIGIGNHCCPVTASIVLAMQCCLCISAIDTNGGLLLLKLIPAPFETPRFINWIFIFTGVDELAFPRALFYRWIMEWLKWLPVMSYSFRGKRSVEKGTGAPPARGDGMSEYYTFYQTRISMKSIVNITFQGYHLQQLFVNAALTNITCFNHCFCVLSPTLKIYRNSHPACVLAWEIQG